MMVVPPRKHSPPARRWKTKADQTFFQRILILLEDETRLYPMGCARGQIPRAKVKRFTGLCPASLPELAAM
jgi:hypothetical protein